MIYIPAGDERAHGITGYDLRAMDSEPPRKTKGGKTEVIDGGELRRQAGTFFLLLQGLTLTRFSKALDEGDLNMADQNLRSATALM
jgi:hypothetical protein